MNLNRCTVINNVEANGNGAFALSTMASRVTATDCAFMYNTASASGGVFFTDSTNLIFSNCEFSTNTAANGSATNCGCGAINMHGSFSGLPVSLTATTCTFENQTPGTPAPPTPRSRTGRVWYVSTAGAGGGTTWTTDEAALATALAGVADGDQIWMKAGAYSIAQTNVSKIISIYGGFAGAEGSPAARVLDGETQRPTNSTTITAAATSRVFLIMPDAIDFMVDGVDFTGGNPNNVGGSVIDAYTSLTIARCLFRANNVTATGVHTLGGAAVRLLGGSGGIPVLNVSNSAFVANTFSQANNNANCGGGAFWICQAKAYFTDCIFDGNTATNTSGGNPGGGAIALYGNATTATMTRCLLQNQLATGSSNRGGGAIYAFAISGINLDSCTLTKNTAQAYGGAVRMDTDSVSLRRIIASSRPTPQWRKTPPPFHLTDPCTPSPIRSSKGTRPSTAPALWIAIPMAR